jgi:hypothetical protein
MLFMVIERFVKSDPVPVHERFTQSGRLMPEGLEYRTSWIDMTGSRCFQIVETADPTLLAKWVDNWKDIIRFEIVPVMEAGEFWAKFEKP